MARRRHTAYITGLAIQAAAFVIICLLSVLTLGGRAFLPEYVDARIHDQLFRLRNTVNKDQPVSEDITLIGIDDGTQMKLGAYGKGHWVMRLPFIDQIDHFRPFRPRVIAYDLMFLDQRTETEIRQDDDGAALFSKEVQDELNQFLETARETGGTNDPEAQRGVVELFGRLSGRISDGLFQSKLSHLQDTPIVLGYHVPVERHNQIRTWSRTDILGTDPDDLSESNGRVLPYLTDMAIPLEAVSNIPADYEFNEYRAKMPGQALLDFSRLGFINGPRDPDGTIRRVPMVYGLGYRYQDPAGGNEVVRRFFVPSMALVVCLEAWGISLLDLDPETDAFPVEVQFGRYIRVTRPDGSQVKIPIDRQGFYYVDFVGDTLAFRNIAFASVGQYENMPEYLTDRIVFIGATMTGATDVGPTPLSENAPLVTVHMNAVSNILTGTFIRPLRAWGQLLTLSLVFALLITTWLTLRPRRYTIAAFAGLLVYLLIAYLGIHFHWRVLPLTGPVLLAALCYMTAIVLHYFTEEKEKKAIRGMFSTMVSGDVLTYIEENPETFSLAGEQREVTVFFSDLAGFTSISESLPPASLVHLLNAYLTPMTDIILNNQGFLDKYEGDAIMAEWGVPFANPDHAKLACWSALEQQAKLDEIRDELQRRFGHALHVRMGINSGLVSAGGMGSERKFDYTVMGDAVNLAARLEPTNKDYNTKIIIGEATYQLARDHIEVRLLDRIIVKGKTQPVQIYELLAKKGGVDSRTRDVMNFYERALRKHWDRDFEAALGLLRKALELDPDDCPSRHLLARCEAFNQDPPPDTWQGEYVRPQKD